MFYVLVVIHNRTCADSASCRSLQAQTDRDFRLLLYDNSDADYGIRACCAERDWTYLGGTGNRGLPAAYNCALDYLAAEQTEGSLCILDDDTGLESSFVSEMKKAAEHSSAEILLPVLSQNGRILSPWRERGRIHFGTYRECAAEPAENLLAFNSGMTVRLAAFRDYRYDERLFLDCVDLSFLGEMKKRGKTIAAVPVFCEQSFSGLEKPPRNAAMKRFGIYAADMRAYYGKNSRKCRYMLLKRAAHLALAYGTARPFGILSGREKKRQEYEI